MTDMMEMLDSVRRDLAQTYAMAFDGQIHRLFGPAPNPEEVARRCRIVKSRDAEGFYDELQLDGIPEFQQRVRFEDGKILLELKNVSPRLSTKESC